jgi:23S rRNA U2552 (ribose-2'-O)-methylase RlmE/FtsJ
MDPLIELLRRDRRPAADAEVVYDTRFELEYYDPTPVTVAVLRETEEPGELYGDGKAYEALVVARESYGKMSNYARVRLLANPFEGISAAAFLNRAALKIASIVRVFPQLVPAVPVLRVGMLAEAPGAMLEYVMWLAQTNGRSSEVSAISLKAGLQWQISDTDRRVRKLFGKDGTGDLTSPDNISSYVEETLKLGSRDLVVADGGVDVDETPEKQETLNAALILGEALCAIQVLAEGGCFVLKVYDCFSRFMADVLQLLCRHFKRVTLFDPLTSRPANAERYVVCRGFTGLHVERRSLNELYTVLTLVRGSSARASASAPRPIASFLPRAPSIITDFIVRLNDWHGRWQTSFLRWSVAVDRALSFDARARPNYPISYNLSRWYEIVGVPFARGRVQFELDSSPCQELRLLDHVAQLAREVSSERDELLPLLFGAIRYSLATGADDPLRPDPSTLDTWASHADALAPLREELTKILVRPRTFEDEPCLSLSFRLVIDGDRRVVRAEGPNHVSFDTQQVSYVALRSFLTGKERGKKRAAVLDEIVQRSQHLERSFTFLKRYEALQLTDGAYRVTYPTRVDYDLYATLLSNTAPAFYSPVAQLEAALGAVGAPLGEAEPEENSTLSLNLLYASEPKLREDLVTRGLALVAGRRKLLVATLSNVPALDRSRYLTGPPTVLPREKLLNAVTGKSLDKRVLLYVLDGTAKGERARVARSVGSVVPSDVARKEAGGDGDEEDSSEEQAERFEEPISSAVVEGEVRKAVKKPPSRFSKPGARSSASVTTLTAKGSAKPSAPPKPKAATASLKLGGVRLAE